MKIENIIFCDDTRIENNGKHILTGVYLEDIQTKLPTALPLKVWLQLFTSRAGEVTIDYRFLIDNKVTATGGGIINVKDKKRIITVGVPQLVLLLEKPCTLSFQIREEGKRWKTAKKIPITHKEF